MECGCYGRAAGPFNTQTGPRPPPLGGRNSFAYARLMGKPSPQQMSDFESDSLSENEWEENGDLAWNEFDWELYLREQEGSIHRYLAFYESLKASPERIDEVADRMGWDRADSEESEDRD